MEKERAYKNLLHKMLIIENVGETFYKSLSLKTKSKDLKLIYERLAFNEQETARYIENGILALDRDHPVLVNGVILNLVKLVCDMLSTGQITWIIKNILKRRIYAKWYNVHKDRDRELWRLLLNHEDLQHKLLSQFWDNKKGGAA